jgi:hypothetical protein
MYNIVILYFIFNVKWHLKISTMFSEIDSNDSKHSDKPHIPYEKTIWALYMFIVEIKIRLHNP